MIRAAKIENGTVVAIWMVPALDAFEGVTLIEISLDFKIGDTWTGTEFVKSSHYLIDETIQPIPAPTKEQLLAELQALTAKINALE